MAVVETDKQVYLFYHSPYQYIIDYLDALHKIENKSKYKMGPWVTIHD